MAAMTALAILTVILTAVIIYLSFSLVHERVSNETKSRTTSIENKHLEIDNRRLKDKVNTLIDRLILTEETLNLSVQELVRAERKTTTVPSGPVDETTKKLIRLAVDNPDSNESRNAAVKACQRLNKQIGN